MQRTPRADRKKPASRSAKLANAGIVGASSLLVLGIGAWVAQEQQAESRIAAEATDYTAPVYELSGDSREVALFIGDSYSAGTGAEQTGQRWTSIVSKEMGWSQENRALGGTGYATEAGREGCGMEECPAYLARFEQTAEDVQADVVVISGGQNDFSTYRDDPHEVERSIHDFYAQVSETYPEADVIVVGPSSPWQINDAARGVDAAVREAAGSIEAKYISLLDPNVIEPRMLIEDRAHVNNDGHAAIAKRVLGALR